MKAKVLEKFRDLKEGKIREKGDIFEVSKERFKAIQSRGILIELIDLKEVAKDE